MNNNKIYTNNIHHNKKGDAYEYPRNPLNQISCASKQTLDEIARPQENIKNARRCDWQKHWKDDNDYNRMDTPSINYIEDSLVYLVVRPEDDVFYNFVVPCIIYRDPRITEYNQYMVDAICKSAVDRLKKDHPDWKHIECHPYELEMESIGNLMYNIHGNFHLFKTYESANTFLYNLRKQYKYREEEKKEESEVKTITLSDIAKMFKVDKDKIILDLTK